jgi:hypothetical protein
VFRNVDVFTVSGYVGVDRGIQGEKFWVGNDECGGYLDKCAGKGEDVLICEVGLAGLSS